MTKEEEGEEQPRIGVYVCHCGLNIGGIIDCEDVREFASTLPHVVIAKDNRYTCSDQGQEIIKQDIKEHFDCKGKVHVVPHGITKNYFKDDPLIRKKYDLPSDYTLCVSPISPRKNILHLLKAHRMLKVKHPLLIIGPKV